MDGYIHIYTGDGKGKTTAALGLTLRAAGAGWKTFFAQFVKGRQTSEIQALDRFGDLVTVRQYGQASFIDTTAKPIDREKAQQGLAECHEALISGQYSLVVLDEANVAVSMGLISVEALCRLIDARPEKVELVLTGRDAHPRIIERADLVTEMREIKHYYNHGVSARRGIEK